jgi:hypothetical protein
VIWQSKESFQWVKTIIVNYQKIGRSCRVSRKVLAAC